MINESTSTSGGEPKPNFEQARQAAQMAHEIVIKLQQMELPQELNNDLAALSTDLGDLWTAQRVLASRLEDFLQSTNDWEMVGNYLIDLKANIDHIAWHVKSVRKPLNKIARFAYQKSLE